MADVQKFLTDLHALCKQHNVVIIAEDGNKGKDFTMSMSDGSEVEYLQVQPSKSEITMKRDQYVAQ